MNGKGKATLDDDLRAALAPDGTIEPLDPARVIAGARRRRKVRGLATAGIAAVVVAGVATGGFLAGGQLLGNAPDPADPGPTTLVSPSSPVPTPLVTPRPPAKTAGPTETPGSSGTANTPGLSTPAAVTVAACVAAAAAEPGPGPTATRRGLLSDETGAAIVIADSRYWAACDNTFGQQVSARRPARLQKPSPQDTDAFAVAGDVIDRPDGQHEFFWAGGMLPDGVATVRYTFADGVTKDAVVDGGFWLLRHVSGQSPPSGPPTTKIRVRLLSASGAVVNDFRLTWGEQTCAQISHGC